MADSAEKLEREVETRRAHVEDTLDKLKDRMSFDQLVDGVGQYVKMDDVRGVLNTAGRKLRDNPVPIGLIGVGVVWMLMGGGSRSRRTWSRPDDRWNGSPQYGGSSGDRWGSGTASYRGSSEWGGPAPDHREDHDWSQTDQSGGQGKVKRVVSGLKSKAGDLVSDAKDAVSSAADKVKSAAEGSVSKARESVQGSMNRASGMMERASGMTTTVKQQVDSHPLLVGAAALVAGAVVGAALPRTRAEDRLMAGPRETLMDTARSAASGLRERVAEAAQSTYDAAVSAARDEGLVPAGEKTVAAKVEAVATAAFEEARSQVEPVLHGDAASGETDWQTERDETSDTAFDDGADTTVRKAKGSRARK